MTNEILFIFQGSLLVLAALLLMRFGQAALVAFFTFQLIVANLFVLKGITLFGFDVTATDVFTIGSLFTLALIQEFYGKDQAKRAVWSSFILLSLFGALSLCHLGYTPGTHDQTHPAYKAILSHTPRLFCSSLTAAFIADRLDIALLNRFKKPLWIRFSLASLISQLIDTILFAFLALYGVFESLGSVIGFSFMVKVIAIALMTPFAHLATSWRKHAA